MLGRFFSRTSRLPLLRWQGRPGWRGLAVAAFQRFEFTSLPWPEFERVGYSRDGILCVKKSRSRHVLRVARPAEFGADAVLWTDHAVFAKRYLINTARRRFGNLLSGGKARREFLLGWRLLALGFETPRPLAYIVAGPGRIFDPPAMRGFSAASSFLLTQELVNAGSVRDWVTDGRAAAGNFYRALAAFLARMHAAGFYHDDCGADNLCVAPGASFAPDPAAEPPAETPSAEARFMIMDIDHGKIYRRGVPHRRRMLNLFQIIRSLRQIGMQDAASRTRFVIDYMLAAGMPVEKALAQNIQRINRIAKRKIKEPLIEN